MLKLELDWASNDEPETGTVCDEDGLLVRVEYDAAPGPSGWPVVRVYASVEGLPSYRAAMALDAWLLDAYGQVDDDERQDLLDLATEV